MIYALFPETTPPNRLSSTIRAIRNTEARVGLFGYPKGHVGDITAPHLTTMEEVVEWADSQKESVAHVVLLEDKLVPIDDSHSSLGNGITHCDVLSCLSKFSTWIECKGIRTKEFLYNHGIDHGWTHFRGVAAISAEIDRLKCKLVINEVDTIPPNELERLASRYPNVKFLCVRHNCPSFMSTEPTFRWERMFHRVDCLAATYPNVFIGTVMDSTRYDHNTNTKLIDVPNLIQLPKDLPTIDRGNRRLTLSLVSRPSNGKNFNAQITAVCKAAKEIELGIFIITGNRELSDILLRRLTQCRIPNKHINWGSWERYINLVNNFCDIGLQVSLAESFNLVAVEHMSMGKPVVGSSAIEYLPSEWQANPQDPNEIASIILDHAQNLDERGKEGKAIAKTLEKRNRLKYVESIKQLLE